jgi:CDP-diacylglycerol--glycerol-3-phosphate 3-phosphatidyltransferase
MATATPTRSPVFNLPNQLTAARFLLGIVLFVLIEVRDLWVWCSVVFAVAAATDWLDGYLARKLQLGSTLGRNLDPLVDKVVICGAYIFLLPVAMVDPQPWLVPWMVTVVVARELIITGLRGFLENLGANFGADWLGKLKMGLQCVALFAIFAALQWRQQPLFVVRNVLIYAMLAATTLSGLQYLWKAVTLLRSNTFN